MTYNVISVYDTDGARYDYTSDGQGHWIPPAGQHGQLTYDGACGYNWTQKDGSNFHFEAPMQQPTGCSAPIPVGLQGRLTSISGRNANNNVTLTYSWLGGDASNPQNLTQIVVIHSDGQALTLAFGPVNGTGPTELASITRPDGAVITYAYDSTGDLTGITRPGNNLTTLSEAYDYTAGPYLLSDVYSPRYVLSAANNGGTAQDGSKVALAYDGIRRATQITDTGLVNFTPQDGMSTVLQASYPSGMAGWRTETFSGYGSGVTSVSDSDGHGRMWTVDSLWRPTQLQVYTGSEWLVSYAAWDAGNNLVATTDARDYETDYAYDANGNPIATAAPLVSTSAGTIRPTTLYSYDAFNNLTSLCDPAETNNLGKNWLSPPSGDSLCPASGAGIKSYAWSYSDVNEPYGQLISATSATGYQIQVQYAAASQGGDFGLVTGATGAGFTQTDGSLRTPQGALTYDAFGNIVSASNGVGTTTAVYDGLNRPTSITDPDSITSYAYYYPDGSLLKSETALQHLRGTGTTYT